MNWHLAWHGHTALGSDSLKLIYPNTAFPPNISFKCNIIISLQMSGIRLHVGTKWFIDTSELSCGGFIYLCQNLFIMYQIYIKFLNVSILYEHNEKETHRELLNRKQLYSHTVKMFGYRLRKHSCVFVYHICNVWKF